jgi:hypothetical protein
LADFVKLPFLVITLDGGFNPALYRDSAQIVDDIVTQLVPEPAAAGTLVLALSAAAAYARRMRLAAAAGRRRFTR